MSENDESWKKLFWKKSIIENIVEVETRLKSPIKEIMTRWLVEERQTLSTIRLRLSLSRESTIILMKHYDLKEAHNKNKVSFNQKSNFCPY